MSTTWTRTVQTGIDWGSQTSLIVAMAPGTTLRRVRFAWGFYGYTAPTASYVTTANNAMVLGLCTVASTHSVPNARTSSSDVNPPLERWIWWESRVPSVKAYSIDGSVVIWEASEPQETVDSKAQVSSTVPSGDTLGLWVSAAPAGAWDASGVAYLWYSASVLTEPTVS